MEKLVKDKSFVDNCASSLDVSDSDAKSGIENAKNGASIKEKC